VGRTLRLLWNEEKTPYRKFIMNQNLFILTASIDEGVMDLWTFKAANKYQVLQYIIQNAWDYIKLFDKMRLFPDDVKTPEQLLKIIDKSHVDGDSDYGFELHQVSEDEICVIKNGSEKQEVKKLEREKAPESAMPAIQKFHFSETTFSELQKIVEFKHNPMASYDAGYDWVTVDNLPSLTEEESKELNRILSYLKHFSPGQFNHATEWARAVYPFLLMAEQDKRLISSEVILLAQYPTFELHGVVDAVLSETTFGEMKAPYHLVIVRAKRGVDVQQMRQQLYGKMLTAARLNWEENANDPQEIFSCYTAYYGRWSFMRAEIAGMETNRPVMTTEHSREYYETHDAETILRILKYIVSR
jgi:hypothetical protein